MSLWMSLTFTSSSLKWDLYPAVKVDLLVEDYLINTWQIIFIFCLPDLRCVCVSSCMRPQNCFEKFRSIQILLGSLKSFLLHFWSPVETISLCPTLFIHLPYSRINGWHPRNSIFKLIISQWFSDTLESTLPKENLEIWGKLEIVHLSP